MSRSSVILIAVMISLGPSRAALSMANDGCKSEFGVYMALALNGNLAVDQCQDGVFGVLLITKQGSHRFASDKTKYFNPAFSPDGRALVFVEVDWQARSSSVHLFDIPSGQSQVLYSAAGAIAYPVITSDRRTVYFWMGKFREKGRTAAAGFVLQRWSPTDGKTVPLDGPFFRPSRLSVDPSGGLHYSTDDESSRTFVARAKRLLPGAIVPTMFDLPGLYGDVTYTAKGYFYSEIHQRPSDHHNAYCIVGPNVPAKKICPDSAFAVSIDGTRVVYRDNSGNLAWMNLN